MSRVPQVKRCGAAVQHRAFAAAACSQLWQEIFMLGREAVASARNQTPAENFQKAEANNSNQFLAGLQDLEQKLKLQVKTWSSSLEQQAMQRKAGFSYWVEPREDGSEFFRRQDGCPAQSLLKTEALAAQAGGLVSVGEIKLSPCQQRLAYTVDDGGNHGSVACIRHLQGCSNEPDLQLPGAVSIEWASDGNFVYTCADRTGRPCQVFMVDTEQAAPPTLIFTEHDDRQFVQLTQSKDESLIMVNSSSKTTSEVHLLATDRSRNTGLVCVQPRLEGLEYFVEHHQGWLYILTNLAPGREHSLCRTPLSQPGRRNWQVVVGERSGASLEDLDVFDMSAVLQWRENGRQQLSVMHFDAIASSPPLLEGEHGMDECDQAVGWQLLQPLLHVPEGLHMAVEPCANLDYHASRFEAVVSSPVNPPQMLSLPLAADCAPSPSHLVEANQAGSLHCTTIWAQAGDGMKVPMTIAYDSARVKAPCSAPALVYAYGAYGQCLDTSYAPEYTVLLEHGFIIGFAHVRGGGELGRRWHQAGSGLRKEQSILDLICCLDHLIAAGYTTPGQIGLHVTSAGGILLGNILNRRPELLGAGIARSPFLDLLDTMSNPEAFLTPHEYAEWGNPTSSPQALDQIKHICPYTNLSQLVEVPLLISASQDDQRVPFSGIQKWLKRLRVLGQGRENAILLSHPQGGHFGYQADLMSTISKELAFLIRCLCSQKLTPSL